VGDRVDDGELVSFKEIAMRLRKGPVRNPPAK